MEPIDLVYRFDPGQTKAKPPPRDADEARKLLEAGNRRYARWTDACLASSDLPPPPSFVIPCGPLDLGLPTPDGLAAKQTPFAVLLGCSDARVPAEIVFGLVRNNLFVIRVAGNVLADECLGSIEYAVHHMESIRIIVVLGHTGCGAVTAAVDTYLNPWAYLEKMGSEALRSILDRIFVPVRKAAKALDGAWGPGAAQQPGYRTALIETAIYVNTLQAAYSLRQELARSGQRTIQVAYGVFDLATHRIRTASRREPRSTLREVILADAPATLHEFEDLASRVAAQAAALASAK